MLYLKNALGGIGRSVSCTARLAFAHAGGAARWRKFALYAAMFVLPGGSIAVVLMMWADRRRAQRGATGEQATASGDASRISDTPLRAVAVTTTAAVAAKPTCSGVQLTCRVATAGATRGSRTRAGTAALHAVHALRRWRRNDA
jgi:hypothetical protein